MRFDTVLNNLVGAAVTTGKVTLYGDGSPWRPVVHVQDVVRAFLAVVEAPQSLVHNQAFNNGTNMVNHRVLELAEIVADTVPGCKIELLNRPEVDRRTYKADFSKMARLLPQVRFEWSVRDGARELYESFKSIRLTHEEFASKRFTRLSWLRHLSDTGDLDENLRWSRPAVTAPERN
jgi:nucleoside-diphosphate-sugar epimerase